MDNNLITKIRQENKLLNEQEIKEHKLILKSKPQNFLLILDNICNLKCIMCREATPPFYKVSDILFNSILNNMKYFETFSCQGGETLLFDKFDILIEKAKEYNVQLTFTTNGQLLTENIIKKFENMNICINISIDGFDKKTYENIRLGASFEKLIDNLEILKNYKNKKGFKNLRYVLFMIPMKQNFNQINNAFDFALKYKFSFIRFLQIRGNYYHPNEEELKNIKEQIYKCFSRIKNEHLPISIDSDIPLDYKKTDELADKLTNKISDNCYTCSCPWTNLSIQKYAHASIDCLCDFKHSDKAYATLEDAWNSQYIQEIRKGLIEKKPVSSCKNCYRIKLFQQINSR